MENTVYLNRSNYLSKKEYLERYHELNKSYDFKVQVEGGWMFFRYITDYLQYKNTK